MINCNKIKDYILLSVKLQINILGLNKLFFYDICVFICILIFLLSAAWI